MGATGVTSVTMSERASALDGVLRHGRIGAATSVLHALRTLDLVLPKIDRFKAAIRRAAGSNGPTAHRAEPRCRCGESEVTG